MDRSGFLAFAFFFAKGRTWCDEVIWPQRQTLGRDRRQSDGVVQRLHKAATEFVDLCERVLLAAPVDRDEFLALVHREFGRGEMPRADRAMFLKLVEKELEAHAAGTGARAGPENGVERFRIARIVNVDQPLQASLDR